MFSLRSFTTGQDTYQLIIRTDSDYKGPIRLVAVGEDGRQEQPSIREAFLSGSDQRLQTQSAIIRDMELSTQEPTRLTVRLANRTKLALNAFPA